MSSTDYDPDEAFLSVETTQPKFDGQKLRPFSAGTSSLLIKIGSPIIFGGTPTHLDVAAFILVHLDNDLGAQARGAAYNNPDRFASLAIDFTDQIQDATTKLQEFIPTVIKMFEQSEYARTVSVAAGKAQKKTRGSNRGRPRG